MKKIIAVLAIGALMASSAYLAENYPVNAQTAAATEVCKGDAGYGEAPPTLEEQLLQLRSDTKNYAKNISATEEKIQNAIAIRDNGLTSALMSSQTRNTASQGISVPCFKQETPYYCGPATVKQVMQYKTGSSDTQSNIAAALHTTQANGTDWTYIRSYLNARQPNQYISVTPSSKTQMENYIITSIATYNSPPILHLKFSSGTVWQYSTNGHYMNAHSLNEYNVNKYIGLTDPYIQRVNSLSLGFYTVTSQDVWNATQAHWAKHLLY